MRTPDADDLIRYLDQKRTRLDDIRACFSENNKTAALFRGNKWYEKVEEQLRIWESDPERSIRRRDISVPEYELFRYFENDQILDRFMASFGVLEESLSPDRTRYRKWKESKIRLFSRQTSQVYSVLFEILILGRLIATGIRVEPYFENIDGRIEIDNRFVYFEIKSLQETRFDLKGIGSGGVQHDEHQVLTALEEKAHQLSPYFGKPILIFLSLYRLADLTTGEWFTREFLETDKGQKISAVILYSWFTAGSGSKFMINEGSLFPFSQAESAFLNDLTVRG